EARHMSKQGTSRPTGETPSRTRFAMVPEWLIYSGVSDRAVRLYGVLARHAQSDGTGADPGRARLARLMRTSRSSLDRARRELEGIGAIDVTRRPPTRVNQDWDTNLYRLRFDPPQGLVTSDENPRHTRVDGLLTGDETVLSPVTNERESLNES